MKKLLLTTTFLFCSIYIFAQNPRKANIDVNNLNILFAKTPHETNLGVGNVKNSSSIISLPMLDGTLASFKIMEYSIFPKGYVSTVKTYLGLKINEPSTSCRITFSSTEITVNIYTLQGIITIERDKTSTTTTDYIIYPQINKGFECGVIDNTFKNGRIEGIEKINNYTNGANLRTYRMALFVTNEFYASNGNSDAAINTYVTTTVNNLNGLYEREIAVRFTLVSPTNPASTNLFHHKTEATSTYNQSVNTLRTEVNTIYGAANYDIGHTLHNTGGGVAFFGVCNDSYKGGGWSGTNSTDILLFGHEVGHQFFAPHTFNGNGSSSCSISNRNTATAYEPGSGSTIMSYHGLCAANQNLTGSKESYFHTHSLQSMITYIQTGTGNTCGVATTTGNTPPVAVAGSNFTIPKNTPFTLIGSGTDANSDALLFTWEEFDVAVASDSGAIGQTSNGTTDAVSSTTAPLFRSRQSSSPIRNFPALQFVLNNANNPPDIEGEDLPNVSRTMIMRLTARDNRAGGGGVDSGERIITVDATKGPFLVTAPNNAVTIAAGSSTTITWSVNNTNTLSANINILLSIDGGNSFPYTLATSTANDGTETLTIPANVVGSTTCRVKIVSTGNATAEFFDISDTNFTITSTCLAGKSLICSDATITAQAGDAALNLGLAQTFVGNAVTSKSIDINNGSPTGKMVWFNTNGTTCFDSPFNQTYNVVTFRVSQSGSYTFTTTSGLLTSFFANTLNPTSPCPTFTGSNATLIDPNTFNTTFQGSYTLTLNSCTTYYMMVFNFAGGNLTGTVTFQSSTGAVYEISTAPAGYDYSYLALNTTTGIFSAVSSTSNFTSLGQGIYDILGISVTTGTNTNTFVGQTSNVVLATNCIQYSENKKRLNITAPTCPQTLTFVSPANNILSGTSTQKANQTITASNSITGGNTTYQAGNNIQMNPGFQVSGGAVYLTKILAGCN